MIKQRHERKEERIWIGSRKKNEASARAHTHNIKSISTGFSSHSVSALCLVPYMRRPLRTGSTQPKRKEGRLFLKQVHQRLSLRPDLTNYFHLLLLDKRGVGQTENPEPIPPRLRVLAANAPHANLLISEVRGTGT